jgi:hypothetical protein
VQHARAFNSILSFCRGIRLPQTLTCLELVRKEQNYAQRNRHNPNRSPAARSSGRWWHVTDCEQQRGNYIRSMEGVLLPPVLKKLSLVSVTQFAFNCFLLQFFLPRSNSCVWGYKNKIMSDAESQSYEAF